jgi:hypothetical protein
MAWFEHQLHELSAGTDPHPRVIYTLVVSCISFIAALVLFIPFTVSIINYTWDFLMAVAWFAAFGVLVDWFGDPECDNSNKGCKRWKTAEAFSFISAILWLLSMLLVLYSGGSEMPRKILTDNIFQGSHCRAPHPPASCLYRSPCSIKSLSCGLAMADGAQYCVKVLYGSSQCWNLSAIFNLNSRTTKPEPTQSFYTDSFFTPSLGSYCIFSASEFVLYP